MPTLPAQDTPFVSTEWLATRLSDPDLQVIDGSWHLPTQNRNGRLEYEQAHIPGAIFLDIDALADASTGLPHMLVDDATFGREAGRLGISSSKTLVVYDGSGLFSAPRVWWMLRLYGVAKVFILDGGFPRWIAEQRPAESGPGRAEPAVFEAKRVQGRVADLDDVRRTLESGDAQVVDARPAARFSGQAPEPRPGIRSGHMPGSLNLPFSALVADGTLAEPGTLRQSFAEAGVDLDKPVMASCGSGVSAAIVVLAMHTLGRRDAVLYDGSWAEYASRPDSIIE